MLLIVPRGARSPTVRFSHSDRQRAISHDSKVVTMLMYSSSQTASKSAIIHSRALVMYTVPVDSTRVNKRERRRRAEQVIYDDVGGGIDLAEDSIRARQEQRRITET